MIEARSAYITYQPGGIETTFNYTTFEGEFVQITISRGQLLNILIDAATALRQQIPLEDATT